MRERPAEVAKGDWALTCSLVGRGIRAVAVMPRFELATAKASGVVPEVYSRKDLVRRFLSPFFPLQLCRPCHISGRLTDHPSLPSILFLVSIHSAPLQPTTIAPRFVRRSCLASHCSLLFRTSSLCSVSPSPRAARNSPSLVFRYDMYSTSNVSPYSPLPSLVRLRTLS